MFFLLYPSSSRCRFRSFPADDAPSDGSGGPRPEGGERRLLQSPQPWGHSQGEGSGNGGGNRRQIQPGRADHPCVRLRDPTLHPLHTVQGDLSAVFLFTQEPNFVQLTVQNPKILVWKVGDRGLLVFVIPKSEYGHCCGICCAVFLDFKIYFYVPVRSHLRGTASHQRAGFLQSGQRTWRER